jgi:hypothetical protein
VVVGRSGQWIAGRKHKIDIYIYMYSFIFYRTTLLRLSG